MSETEVQTLLAFFRALADESRLRLLGLIADRERSVQELAALLALKEPTISHHLAMLKRVGLVRLRIEGTRHWYRLDSDVLHRKSREILADRIEKAAVPEG